MTKAVFKIGGSILQELPKSFYQLLIDLKEKGICDPVIVHGGLVGNQSGAKTNEY